MSNPTEETIEQKLNRLKEEERLWREEIDRYHAKIDLIKTNREAKSYVPGIVFSEPNPGVFTEEAFGKEAFAWRMADNDIFSGDEKEATNAVKWMLAKRVGASKQIEKYFKLLSE